MPYSYDGNSFSSREQTRLVEKVKVDIYPEQDVCLAFVWNMILLRAER